MKKQHDTYRRVELRLSEEDYEYLQKASKEMGFTSMAGFIRHWISYNRIRQDVLENPQNNPLQVVK